MLIQRRKFENAFPFLFLSSALFKTLSFNLKSGSPVSQGGNYFGMSTAGTKICLVLGCILNSQNL